MSIAVASVAEPADVKVEALADAPWRRRRSSGDLRARRIGTAYRRVAVIASLT
jgi:hypothetical protein